MRWKTPDLEAEFHRAAPRAQALALYADAFSVREFGQDLVVTDVERTQKEYDQVYGVDGYTGPRPHLGPPSRAVDFRTNGELTSLQIDNLVKHINSHWLRPDGKPTALYHDVGAGSHIHIQVPV